MVQMRIESIWYNTNREIWRNYQQISRMEQQKKEKIKKLQNNKDSILCNQTCLYIYIYIRICFISWIH